jgi:uncharacterized protein YeeX (DUF496 family)
MDVPEFVDETGEDVLKKKLRLNGKTPSAVEKHTSAVETHTSSSLQKSLTIYEPADEIPLRRLNPTGSHIASIFLYSGGLLTSLKFFVILGFTSFAVFEENARKLSSSELANFKKTYDLKASLVGKVVSERLLEKEELIGKLFGESNKLKRELNKALVSSVDLEQRISELTDSLKRCQDEKRPAKAALQDSKNDLVKLDKTHEDVLKMIENLRKDSDKNAKTVDELRDSKAELSTKNTDLTKTLSRKEQ